MSGWRHLFSLQGVSNIVLHVTLIVAFISIFFFTYGSYIEKKVVDNQMEILVENFTADIDIFPDNVRDLMSNTIQNIELPDMKKEDEAVKTSNTKLKKRAFTFIGTLTVVGILTMLILWVASGRKFSLKSIIMENVGLLIVVGLTEFMFTTFVLKNYRSADPNIIKKQVVDNLSDYGKTC